jgi:hypothetical protein
VIYTDEKHPLAMIRTRVMWVISIVLLVIAILGAWLYNKSRNRIIHLDGVPGNSVTASSTIQQNSPLQAALATDLTVYDGGPSIDIGVMLTNSSDREVAVSVDACTGASMAVTLQKFINSTWMPAVAEEQELRCMTGPDAGETDIYSHAEDGETLDFALIPSSIYRLAVAICLKSGTRNVDCADAESTPAAGSTDRSIVFSNTFSTKAQTPGELAGTIVQVNTLDANNVPQPIQRDWGIRTADGRTLELLSNTVSSDSIGHLLGQQVQINGYTTGAVRHGPIDVARGVSGGFYVLSIRGQG